MSFDEWLKIGTDAGWCSPTVCYTHQGLPLTREEDDMFTEGYDVCVHIIRLYESADDKISVEENFPLGDPC